MKNAFVLSVILHIVIVFISVQAVYIKRETKRQNFFYADIVRPEVSKDDLRRETPAQEKKGKIPHVKQQAKKIIPKRPSPDSKTAGQGNRDQSSTNVAKKEEKQESSIPPPSIPPRPDPILPTEPKLSQPKKEEITRENLFDRRVIRDIAKAYKPETKQDDTITFDTKEFKYHAYLRRLKERIESVWKYPQEAAERGIYGDLYIRFTIKKNGRIGSVELLRTSGHRLLDEAAIKALKDGDPYWPLPDEFGSDSFTITGHFVYSIYGMYLR